MSGCATQSQARTEAPPEPAVADAAAAVLQELWPISPRRYRTTSADIYLGNLDSRIATLDARVQAGDASRTVALAGALYHRYKVRGRLADAERAQALLQASADAGRLDPEGMLLLATALSGMHRFDAAEQWLQRARDAGVSSEKAAVVNADVAVAQGNYAALSADFAASSTPAPEFYLLAHLADLRVLQGDLAGAERHYHAAQTLYHDVNPVPLAWLHTQMGIALLRHGRTADARRFFQAAVDRLPGYYLAEEHLAECEALLGDTDAARARYRRVIEQTGNPEFLAALASVEREAGHEDEARRLEREALAGYEDLLQRHPAAFGQHAAEFLIEIGETERADALARSNLALRQDIGSWILQAQTALALGDTARACAARNAAVQTALRPPELSELDALAPRCR